MVNNFEQIKGLLNFESDDDFYFVQILKRRKDNPKMDTGTAVIKEYYVDSLEYFEKKESDIIENCEKHNARATIRLNKRGYRKVSHKLLIDVAEKIDAEQYKAVKGSFSRIAGKFGNDKDKKWIIDIDDMTLDLDDMELKILQMQPEGNKLKCIIPSKSGCHLIVKPFDMRDFKKMYPDVDIQKDSPTNLYIP